MGRILWAVSSLVLLFTVTGVLAQAQENQQGTPTAVKAAAQEPNRNTEPNAEQLRQDARQRMRQSIMERRRRGMPGDMNAPIPSAGSPVGGTARQQQPADVNQRIAQGQAKHLERLARLNRVRELAQQQNNTDTVARADKLLNEENRLYEAKMQRMTAFKNRMAEHSKRTARQAGAAEANKDGNRPPSINK